VPTSLAGWCLLTDGRTGDQVADLTRPLPGLDALVIDCELGRVRLGLARRLAGALRAAYVHVDALLMLPDA
jgi:magnesium chelatase subunit D